MDTRPNDAVRNDAVRSGLLQLLSKHLPGDQTESAHLDVMRTHAARLPAPLSRHQATAHFTGSALVMSADGRRVCLVHHAKLGKWLQPGGHAEPGDRSLEETALREAREETALEVRLHPSAPRPFDVDVHSIPARKDEPAHLHLDVRYLVVTDVPEALVHDPAESLGAKWWTWEEAERAVDDVSLGRLLTKARRFGVRL